MDSVTFVYVLSVGRIHEILELVTIQLELFKIPQWPWHANTEYWNWVKFQENGQWYLRLCPVCEMHSRILELVKILNKKVTEISLFMSCLWGEFTEF